MHINIITPAAGVEANRDAGSSLLGASRMEKEPSGARCLGMLIDMFCEVASMIRIKRGWGLPGGPVVKNLPSNAGDLGLILG